MHAIEIRFHSILVQLINKERSRQAQHLADGIASDWADYKKRVGILEGLAMARELAKQLADESEGRERDLTKMMETDA